MVSWWLESMWKAFQSMYVSRARDIERYLCGENPPVPLGRVCSGG
jgi:hypothetical protein